MNLRGFLRDTFAFGDPMPGPGVVGGMSYAPGQNMGRVRLVAARGRMREATYREIYLANPYVWAATNHIARGIGRFPLHLFQLDAAGDKTRIRADVPGASRYGPAQLDRILNVPAGRISRSAFWSSTVRDRLVLGSALWRILYDNGPGMPTGVQRIPWKNVGHVEEDGMGGALYYEMQPSVIGAKRERLGADEVIHFGLGSEGDQASGVSVLESCSATIALHDALLRHLLGYFENSARPSGHIQVERASREKLKELRELMTELYASPENAGKILVTTGTWQSMSDSPSHSQIVELLKESRVEIATAFQVPPPVLGMLENAIRANVKELREQFIRETMGPWANEFEDELHAQFIAPLYPTVFAEFQLAESLRPDMEARAMVYQRLMHVFTIDEIRKIENMQPLNIAGVTDIPWVASGAMPLTRASQAASRVTAPPGPPAAPRGDAVREAVEALARNGNGHSEGSNPLNIKEVLTR